MTIDECKDKINKKLPDRTKASDPMYPAAIVREVLFTVLDAAQGLIDALKESISKKLNVVDFNNGLRFNNTIRLSPEAGKPVTRYFRIAQLLQYDDANASDLLALSAVVGGWVSTGRESIALSCGNRGRFGYHSQLVGAPSGCGFAAFEQPDKTVFLYLKLPNNFFLADVSVHMAYQANVFADWREEVPSGTLVYDSTDRINYPPTMSLDAGALAVRGMLRTGAASKAFQVTSVKPGSGLTVNTSQFLEIKLEDGTNWKVPTFN